jgi:uncharacterized protein Smg (DUF494 family)
MFRMERIIQIINHVMKEILRHDSNVCSKQSLTRDLLQLGYDIDDIDTAFQSLYAVPLFLSEEIGRGLEVHQSQRGHRILGQAERKKLSLAFQGEIMRLMNCSILSAEEIEQILLEAMRLEMAEVGLKELEYILQQVIKDEERLLLILPYRNDVMPSLLPN